MPKDLQASATSAVYILAVYTLLLFIYLFICLFFDLFTSTEKLLFTISYILVIPFCLHPTGPCLNFHFYNDAGVPFMLYSNLKPEGYLVTGPEIHLHYVIRNGNTVGLTELPHKREKIPDSVGEMLSEVSILGL